MVISPSLHLHHTTLTITTVSLDDTHEGSFFLQIPSGAQAGAFELKRVDLGLKSTKLTSHLRHVLLTRNDKKLFRVRFLPPLPRCGLNSPSLENGMETWANSRDVCSLQLLTRLPGSGLNHKKSAYFKLLGQCRCELDCSTLRWSFGLNEYLPGRFQVNPNSKGSPCISFWLSIAPWLASMCK